MPFLTAVRDHGLAEGSVIDIKVTTPDGKNLATNIKLNANDMEAIQTILNMDFQHYYYLQMEYHCYY